MVGVQPDQAGLVAGARPVHHRTPCPPEPRWAPDRCGHPGRGAGIGGRMDPGAGGVDGRAAVLVSASDVRLRRGGRADHEDSVPVDPVAACAAGGPAPVGRELPGARCRCRRDRARRHGVAGRRARAAVGRGRRVDGRRCRRPRPDADGPPPARPETVGSGRPSHTPACAAWPCRGGSPTCWPRRWRRAR